jgi:hypothetical protein
MPRNDFDPADLGDAELAIEPQRTSILAILSLICSLLCIIPGMGLLATILGISAAVGISGSRGRVGGMGLAIAGIVLGLLFSMLWVGAAIGAKQAFGFFQGNLIGPGGQVMSALDSGDLKGARALFTPDADARITDEELLAFRSAYQAELGLFKSVPQKPLELYAAYREVVQAFKPLQGKQNVFPIPGDFDKGIALIVFTMDPGAGRQSNPPNPKVLPVTNIAVMTPAGKIIELVPSMLSPPPPRPSAPVPPATPPPAPAPDPSKAPGSGG